MGDKKKNRTTQFAIFALLVVALALAGTVFQIAGTSQDTPTGNVINPSVQCNKDFTDSVSFTDRDFYEQGTDSGTVVYKVWKVESSGNKIPKADINDSGSLTIAYNEAYEVVATQDNSTNVRMELAVDAECNVPEDQLVLMLDVPESVDATFESSKITGPNSESNKIPVPIDDARSVTATFNGESKSSAKAIVVIEVDKDLIDDVSADKGDATVPTAHSASAVNNKVWAFELGTLDQARDNEIVLDFHGDKDASAQDVNVTYTVYLKQNGYIDSDTGLFMQGLAVEDNDDELLLPSQSGTIFLTLQ